MPSPDKESIVYFELINKGEGLITPKTFEAFQNFMSDNDLSSPLFPYKFAKFCEEVPELFGNRLFADNIVSEFSHKLVQYNINFKEMKDPVFINTFCSHLENFVNQLRENQGLGQREYTDHH